MTLYHYTLPSPTALFASAHSPSCADRKWLTEVTLFWMLINQSILNLKRQPSINSTLTLSCKKKCSLLNYDVFAPETLRRQIDVIFLHFFWGSSLALNLTVRSSFHICQWTSSQMLSWTYSRLKSLICCQSTSPQQKVCLPTETWCWLTVDLGNLLSKSEFRRSKTIHWSINHNHVN